MSNQGLKEKVNYVKQLYSSLDEHADVCWRNKGSLFNLMQYERGSAIV